MDEQSREVMANITYNLGSTRVYGYTNNTAPPPRNFSVHLCYVNMFETLDHNEQQNTFSFVVNGILISTLGLFGFVTSLVSAGVFYSMRAQLNRYLLALSFWNALVALFIMLLFSAPMLLYGRLLPDGTTYLYLYPYIYTISTITMIGCVWTLIALCIDRYFAVCHPIKHKLMLADNRRATLGYILLGAALIAVLLGIPKYFELAINHCFDKVHSKYVPFIMTTNLYHNKFYSIGYRTTTMFFAYSLAPCLTLLALTLRITYSLKKSLSFRNKMTITKILELNATVIRQASSAIVNNVPETAPHIERRRKQRMSSRESGSTNNMIYAVMCKFQLTHILSTCIDILEIIALHWPETGRSIYANVQYVIDMSNLLIIVNIATDFLVYLYFGRQFRTAFWHMWKMWRQCKCGRPRQGSPYTTMSRASRDPSVNPSPGETRRYAYEPSRLNRNQLRQLSVRLTTGASRRPPANVNTCIPYHFTTTADTVNNATEHKRSNERKKTRGSNQNHEANGLLLPPSPMDHISERISIG